MSAVMSSRTRDMVSLLLVRAVPLCKALRAFAAMAGSCNVNGIPRPISWKAVCSQRRSVPFSGVFRDVWDVLSPSGLGRS